MNIPNDSDPTESSDFMQKLITCHLMRGVEFYRYPEINGKPVDLYTLFSLVQSHGGLEKVTEKGLWADIADAFGVGIGCTNGSEAIKCIYLRYIYFFERNLQANDDHSIIADEEDESRRKSYLSSQRIEMPSIHRRFFPPSDAHREALRLKQIPKFEFNYEKLKMSLTSGLPNEVTFVLNSILLISTNPSRMRFNISQCPIILDLVLAQIGVFAENDPFRLLPLYIQGWNKSCGYCFLKFWHECVKDEALTRKFISSMKNKKVQSLKKYNGTMNLSDQGPDCKEEVLAKMIAAILKNLSENPANARHMSLQQVLWSFLVLTVSCDRKDLMTTGLDTMSEICKYTKFNMVGSVDFQEIVMCRMVGLTLSSKDYRKMKIGLEILGNFCHNNENRLLLLKYLGYGIRKCPQIENGTSSSSSSLPAVCFRLLDSLTAILSVGDALLTINGLEFLYQLTMIHNFRNNRHAYSMAWNKQLCLVIEFLVGKRLVQLLNSLLVVGAKPLAHGGLAGIKIVEESAYPTMLCDSQLDHQQMLSQRIPVENDVATILAQLDPAGYVANWIFSTFSTQHLTCVLISQLYRSFNQYFSQSPAILRLAPYLLNAITSAIPNTSVDFQQRIVVGLGYISSLQRQDICQQPPETIQNSSMVIDPQTPACLKRTMSHQSSPEIDSSGEASQEKRFRTFDRAGEVQLANTVMGNDNNDAGFLFNALLDDEIQIEPYQAPIERIVNSATIYSSLAPNIDSIQPGDSLGDPITDQIAEVADTLNYLVSTLNDNATGDLLIDVPMVDESLSGFPRVDQLSGSVNMSVVCESPVLQYAKHNDLWTQWKSVCESPKLDNFSDEMNHLQVRHVMLKLINHLEIQIADNPNLFGDPISRSTRENLSNVIEELHQKVKRHSPTLHLLVAGTVNESELELGLVPEAIQASDLLSGELQVALEHTGRVEDGCCTASPQPEHLGPTETPIHRYFNHASPDSEYLIGSTLFHDCFCEWQSCFRIFEDADALFKHIIEDHINDGKSEIYCQLSRCDPSIGRGKWSFINHLKETHFSLVVIRNMLDPIVNERTITSGDFDEQPTESVVNDYSRSFASTTFNGEGPLTKSIRLLAALCLRNMSRSSKVARKAIHNSINDIISLAFEDVEASKVLAETLVELVNIDGESNS